MLGAFGPRGADDGTRTRHILPRCAGVHALRARIGHVDRSPCGESTSRDCWLPRPPRLTRSQSASFLETSRERKERSARPPGPIRICQANALDRVRGSCTPSGNRSVG